MTDTSLPVTEAQEYYGPTRLEQNPVHGYCTSHRQAAACRCHPIRSGLSSDSLSCETNPIWSEGCNRHQGDGTLCKTKPNLGRIECLGKGRHCIREPSPESGMRKTNPIWGRVKRGITTAGEMGYERGYSLYVWEKQSQFRRVRPGAGGQLRKTKPISENRAAGGISQYSTIPSFQYPNPVPIVQNKPNLWRRRLGRGLGNGWRGRSCETKPIPQQGQEQAGHRLGVAGVGCTNKANLPAKGSTEPSLGPLRQTKPISPA